VNLRLFDQDMLRKSKNTDLYLFSVSDMYPKTTFLFVDRLYHKATTSASFEIKFLPGTKNKTMVVNGDVPIAFCDNMHISLEFTSAVSVINFGF
jgi:hypothetical protein